jgi:glutathione S-transferase
MVEIYFSGRCPFCIKVVRAAEQMGLVEGEDYRLIEAGPGTAGRQTVIDTGGREMVPFLIDGEVSMYESDDIIAYLRTRIT